MEQSDLAAYVVQGLERIAVPYAVVGSYASMAYGEVRLTRDVDILIELSDERDQWMNYALDMAREASPMCAAEDAVELDTTALEVDAVLAKLRELVVARGLLVPAAQDWT